MTARRRWLALCACAAVLVLAAWSQQSDDRVGAEGLVTLTLEDMAGTTAVLPSSGAPTLVVVFSTDCAVCAQDAREWDQLGDELGVAGLDVVALSASSSATETAAFITANHVDVRVLVDEDGVASRVLGVVGVPRFILFDSGGRIVARGALENIKARLSEGEGL